MGGKRTLPAGSCRMCPIRRMDRLTQLSFDAGSNRPDLTLFVNQLHALPNLGGFDHAVYLACSYDCNL